MNHDDKPSREQLEQLYACIDNTSLQGSDTAESITALCRNAVTMADPAAGIPTVAAVCVYPLYVSQVRRQLADSGIRVAAVAGGFPAGQLPTELKLHEVRYAIACGADEIDFVINRGDILSGHTDRVVDEVFAVRAVCGDKVLKVILETGELQRDDAIHQAAMAAMTGGADFIKTSTGKTAIGATLPAARVMLEAIAEYRGRTGRNVGFKAAGGISTPVDALAYYDLASAFMPGTKLSPQCFRIGASRLVSQLYALLKAGQ